MIDYPVYLRKQADWAEDELPNTAKTFRDAAAEFERLQALSEIPCCKCGGPVVEFSISNEVWNRLVRKGGPETDQEYLCIDCFAGIAAAEIERLQQYPSVIASMKQGSFTDARVCEDIERRVKEEWRLAAPLDVCHRPEVCCDCEHETACDALCDHRRRDDGDAADKAREN